MKYWSRLFHFDVFGHLCLPTVMIEIYLHVFGNNYSLITIIFVNNLKLLELKYYFISAQLPFFTLLFCYSIGKGCHWIVEQFLFSSLVSIFCLWQNFCFWQNFSFKRTTVPVADLLLMINNTGHCLYETTPVTNHHQICPIHWLSTNASCMKREAFWS